MAKIFQESGLGRFREDRFPDAEISARLMEQWFSGTPKLQRLGIILEKSASDRTSYADRSQAPEAPPLGWFQNPVVRQLTQMHSVPGDIQCLRAVLEKRKPAKESGNIFFDPDWMKSLPALRENASPELKRLIDILEKSEAARYMLDAEFKDQAGIPTVTWLDEPDEFRKTLARELLRESAPSADEETRKIENLLDEEEDYLLEGVLLSSFAAVRKPEGKKRPADIEAGQLEKYVRSRICDIEARLPPQVRGNPQAALSMIRERFFRPKADGPKQLPCSHGSGPDEMALD